MATRDMETVIRISGQIDASLRRVLEQAAQRIEQLSDVTDQAADAVDRLNDVMGDQRDELKRMQKQYAAYVLSGEKSSDAAKDLRKKIKNLSSELSGNEKRMRDAEEAAQRLAGGLDDVDDAARDVDGGFTVMKGAMANLVSSGIQAVIGGCIDAAQAIYGLADSTREFRQDQATLETAFDRAGFTAEQATDTWTDLYALFGEDDRAVEAANNISRIADSQAELDQWTRITAGVWGTYQDALPVENLAEAAAETANTGTVTGGLADALNWSTEAAAMFADYMGGDVVTAEDAFNAALAECNDAGERAALITETLTALYGDSADAYYESAGSLIEANKAQADYSKNLAEIGERIEPVTTAVKSGLAGMLGAALDLFAGADVEGFADGIAGAFQNVTDVIMPIAQKVLPSLSSVFGTVLEIAAPLGELTGEIAEAVLPVLSEAINTILEAISPLVPIITNLASSLLPVITTLVEALAPVVSTLFQALEPVLSAIGTLASGLIPPLISVINILTPGIQFLAQVISGTLGSAMQAIMPIIQNVIGIFEGLASFLQNVFLGNWSGVWESAKRIFSNAFQALAGIAKAPINAVISIVNGVISAINSVGFDIPDWVPLIGGSSFRLNIPQIPLLATGGFTEGPSIAGEAGTEAVISFDRAFRRQNLEYWARAGRMLGATPQDAGFDPIVLESGRVMREAESTSFELSGEPGGSTVIDMGGVTFAPNINITEKADKESVIKAIEAEYPEFLDVLETWLLNRGVNVYA